MKYLTSVLLCISVTIAVNAQEFQLTAFDGDFAELFGYSVAIDGDYAIVGAPLQSGFGTNNAGAAYIFHFDGVNWVYEDKLYPPWGGSLGDQFGYSVDIEGDRAIVGARNTEHYGYSQVGSAYVFARSGTDWNLIGTLYPSDGQQGDQFGNKVGISGNYAIVAAAKDSDYGNKSGAAYIFEYHYGSWVEEVKLHASDADAGDAFGSDVAISGDHAVVGAPANMGVEYLQSGAVYIFHRSHYYGWGQVERLTHSDAEIFDHLGASVDIEGDYVIAGAPFANDKTGKAYIFARSGYDWYEQDILEPSDGAPHDKFGTSVGITLGRAAVGSYLDDDDGPESGSMYVFEQAGVSWSEFAKYTASDAAAGDWFGHSVDIDGSYSIAGAQNQDVVNTDAGAAYIYGPAMMADCYPSRYLEGAIMTGTYQASDHIIADGQIPGSQQVVLGSPNYISLDQGFEIAQGSSLEISMSGCN